MAPSPPPGPRLPAYASAASGHPVPAHATGEVVGTLFERLGDGPPPDLVLVAVTVPLVGAVEDIVAAVDALLRPSVVAGVASRLVVAGDVAATDVPAVGVWAARWGARPHAVHVDEADGTGLPSFVAGFDGEDLRATPGALGSGTAATASLGTTLVLADPFTAPAAELAAVLCRASTEIAGSHRVLGGDLDAAAVAGRNRLVLGGTAVGPTTVQDHGALVIRLPAVSATASTASASRPMTDPVEVTEVVGGRIAALAGRRAHDVVQAAVRALRPDVRRRLEPHDLIATVAAGLHGRHPSDPGADRSTGTAGEVVVAAVRGSDPAVGSVALDVAVEAGDVVQFGYLDASAAGEELARLVPAPPPGGALGFVARRGDHLGHRVQAQAAALAALGGTLPVAAIGVLDALPAAADPARAPSAGRSTVGRGSTYAWLPDP